MQFKNLAHLKVTLHFFQQNDKMKINLTVFYFIIISLLIYSCEWDDSLGILNKSGSDVNYTCKILSIADTNLTFKYGGESGTGFNVALKGEKINPLMNLGKWKYSFGEDRIDRLHIYFFKFDTLNNPMLIKHVNFNYEQLDSMGWVIVYDGK